MRRFEFVCEESVAREIEELALEYGLTERAVLKQLVSVGLSEIDDSPSTAPRLPQE